MRVLVALLIGVFIFAPIIASSQLIGLAEIDSMYIRVDNHLTPREKAISEIMWTPVFSTPDQKIIYAYDKKSFKITSEKERAFIFDFAVVFGDGTFYKGIPVLGVKATAEVSCDKRTSNIISDVIISEQEKIIAENQLKSNKDFDSIKRSSFMGAMIARFCDKKQQEPKVEYF